MSRLNSKLVLKALPPNANGDESYEIVKTVNTLEHGIPGDKIPRKEVDKILKAASGHLPATQGTLTVEFVK